MEISEGTRVTSNIRLVRPLGAGGMGSVWIAEHASLKTEVVVKFLHDRLAEDPTSRSRFSREAAAAAKVKSPHVVQILDHGVTDDGHAFIVMELLEGRDLGRELKQRALSPPEVAHVIEHVSLALARAHGKGIVHRDIKPSNIFLCDVGSSQPFVKLLDFGIAIADLEHLTTTGHVVGTPAYMSPEQLAGDDLDFRSDLWSLGIVGFRALTGRLPFERPAVGEVIAAILYDPLPRPSERTPELPVTVDAWFQRACARDRSLRFGSAIDMAEALWRAIGVSRALVSSPSHEIPTQPSVPRAELLQLPTEPLTDGTLRSSVRESRRSLPPRRRRRMAALAAGAVLISGGAAAVALNIDHAEPSSLDRGLATHGARLARAATVQRTPVGAPAESAAAVPSVKRKPARTAPRKRPAATSDPNDVSDLGF